MLKRLAMRFAILVSITLLGACASASDARPPSLATRPGERVSGNAEVPPAPPPPPATAATGDKLTTIVAQARAAHGRFGQRQASADRASRAAQGAGVASEAWSVAQIELAALESARSEAMVAMADLDSLHIAAQDAAVATGGSGDVDATGAARDAVAALIAEEDSTLAAYRGRLRQ